MNKHFYLRGDVPFMSLLWTEYESEFQNVVDAAFQYECTAHPDYYARISPKVERIIYRDTRYNADYLYTAYLLNDDKIMSDYAAWLFELLASVLKDRQTREQTAEYTIDNFTALAHGVKTVASAEKRPQMLALLETAKQRVRDTAARPAAPIGRPSRFEAQIKEYMDCLLAKDSKHALFLIQSYLEKGISLSDIYAEILAESMRRVGELWHTARITVDTEHYCTSVTQMAMAQLYPELFDTQRCGRTILCACPGTELHEMGARMVADLFEHDGWDSIYLGAAVPEDAMLDAVRENQPDLVALSVTMPQHLLTCQQLAQAIRREFPSVKIAVGGKAFESTHEIWRHWPVDLYTRDARDFVREADALFA